MHMPSLLSKGNRSIPLSESHKSIETKTNSGYKQKSMETHQLLDENNKTNNKPTEVNKNRRHFIVLYS